MFSPKVVISRNANSSVTQMSSNVTSIGSSAGSVICQLPNNASAIGAASLSSNTQISFSGEPVGQGPVGVTETTFHITGVTGTKSETIEETALVLEEKIVNNACCVKWY
jgi:hypothetical protein